MRLPIRRSTRRSTLAALALAACAPWHRAPDPRPHALAGLWVDVARTAPGDTAYWRLLPDGRLRAFRRDERFAPRASWYVRAAAGGGAPTLCVHGRRVSYHCTSFALDTLADGGRRLRLGEYRGAFRVPPRTLVEARAPRVAEDPAAGDAGAARR